MATNAGVDDVATRSANLYRELSAIPVYLAAQFQSSNILRVTSSSTDHARNVKRTSIQTFVISTDAVATTFAPDTAEIVASSISPSGKLLAVLREISDQTTLGGKKRFVEVWSGDRLEVSREVTNIHGAFYNDELLSLLSFSPSEMALVYTAEAKEGNSDDSDPLAKYRFVPAFGEGYPGKKKSELFLFRWNTKDRTSEPSLVALHFNQPPPYSVLLSQAVFASDEKILVIGQELTLDNRLLGIKFCPNRLAGVWELTVPTSDPIHVCSGDSAKDILKCDNIKLTSPDRSSRCPRVLHIDGKPTTLVWITNAVGGPHASCSSLHTLDLSSEVQKVVVGTVWDPAPNAFPGIYTTSLPVDPFIQLGSQSFVATTSIWGSRSTALLISLENDIVQDLTPDDGDVHYSWTVLGTDGKDQIVCWRSAPAIPQELVIGKIDASRKVQWRVIAKPTLGDSTQKVLSALQISVLPIPGRQPTETIVLRSKSSATESKPSRCITVPHGGPHGNTITTFSAQNVAFAWEGYVVSLPNYTGSLGYGETTVRKLLGQIGTLDVEDCIATVRHLIDIGITQAGPGQQFLFGGSHGGFLLGHLIGQYPDVFSGAALRNPVISLGEISTSDIPDWYYEEAGILYTPSSIITPEVYEKLYRMSPIAYVDAVRTPVQLLIGEKDLRVAPTQGKNYYHALKARGKDAELICFKEDAHGLESVEATRVSFESARALFYKHQT